MRTRSPATKEMPVHQNVKDAASDLDTRLVMRSLRNTEWVLTNVRVERLIVKGRKLWSVITFADVPPEVAGVDRRIMKNGDMGAGA